MKRRASMPGINFAGPMDSNAIEGKAEEAIFSIALKPARRRGSISIFDFEAAELQIPTRLLAQPWPCGRPTLAPLDLPAAERDAPKYGSEGISIPTLQRRSLTHPACKYGSEADALSPPERRRNPINAGFDMTPLPTKGTGEGRGIIIEDEETALARGLVEQMKALKAIDAVMKQDIAKALQDAIASARSAGIDGSKLTRPEVALKRLKAAEMRKQMQAKSAKPVSIPQGSISNWAPRKFPGMPGLESNGARTSSKEKISPDGHARRIGMMEAFDAFVDTPAKQSWSQIKMTRGKQSASMTDLNSIGRPKW